MKLSNSAYPHFLIFFGLTIFWATALAKPISFDTLNEITGRVIGPITSGQIADGTEVKAYHLKIDRRIAVNDVKSSCGPQKIRSLPILVEDMGRYKNKKIKMTASIQCIESKLGTYAIDRIDSVKSFR